MEEIMKKIKSGLVDIKKEQEKLSKLEDNSKKLQVEAKKIEEERDQINDTESGFYKDLSEKLKEKNEEFVQANIERMNEDKYINKLISSKREEIVTEIEAKMKYIDENRNISLDGIDTEKLKDEKETLEKEIKLNDTTKEEFEKMSDSDKQAVRKAKENYLNNKHRLAEINPTVELVDALDGKEPKDRFIEMESLLKDVNDNFNRDNIDEFSKNIQKDENWYDEKGFKEALEEAQIRKTEREEKERKNSQMSKEEFATIYNPNYKTQEEKYQEALEEAQIIKTERKEKEKENSQMSKEEFKNVYNSIYKGYSQGENAKYNIVLDISGNIININKDEKTSYKEELRNKEEIREKYGLGSYFISDKKTEKNVDYALIAALEKIDDKDESLVKAYLKIIRDGKTPSKEIKESIEKMNKTVDIEYKFDKEESIFKNWKEKRIARYAKKMGIASLEGISEKSLWDKIQEKISKIKNINLLKGKEKQAVLGDGKQAEDAHRDDMKQASIKITVKVPDEVIKRTVEVGEKASKTEKEVQEQISKDIFKIKQGESQANDDIEIK